MGNSKWAKEPTIRPELIKYPKENTDVFMITKLRRSLQIFDLMSKEKGKAKI